MRIPLHNQSTTGDPEDAGIPMLDLLLFAIYAAIMILAVFFSWHLHDQIERCQMSGWLIWSLP